MRRLRISSPLGRLLWVACLAVALVFIQGVRLHLHVYDHPATPEHVHQQHAHVDQGSLEQGHPDEVAQIDLSQQGFLKKLTLGSLAIALFAALILLLPRRLGSQLSWRPYRHAPVLSWPFTLRPPLRAPPL